jgi:hypothetical protein
MKTLLFAVGLGILIANAAAVIAGTRQGIGGMLTIDVLCVVTLCVVGAIWLALQMIGPAHKSTKTLSARAEGAAVNVGARGLRAGRRINQFAKRFADRVRDRADERRK